MFHLNFFMSDISSEPLIIRKNIPIKICFVKNIYNAHKF